MTVRDKPAAELSFLYSAVVNSLFLHLKQNPALKSLTVHLLRTLTRRLPTALR